MYALHLIQFTYRVGYITSRVCFHGNYDAKERHLTFDGSHCMLCVDKFNLFIRFLYRESMSNSCGNHTKAINGVLQN